MATITKTTKTKVELTPAQATAKLAFDKARNEFMASIGKPVKGAAGQYGGFTGNELVTVVPGNAYGFASAGQPEIAKRIQAAGPAGVRMADVIAWGGAVDGFAWVAYRLKGGSIALNGYTVPQAYAALAEAKALLAMRTA